MKGSNRLLRLPPRPLTELLGDLQLLAERQRQGEPAVDIPRITLWLNGGQKLQGQLVCFQAREGLLLVRDASSLDATYLALSEVRALTVHYSEENLHTLSAGVVVKMVGEAPGGLELKRRLAHLSETVGVPASLTFDEFPDSDEARHVLGLALADVEGVIRQIVADPEGRESFQAVKDLQIRPSAQGPSVSRSGAVLLILLGLESGQVSALTAGKLKQAIEKLL